MRLVKQPELLHGIDEPNKLLLGVEQSHSTMFAFCAFLDEVSGKGGSQMQTYFAAL